jgi:Spy/CpxP family protein refolding chaperone
MTKRITLFLCAALVLALAGLAVAQPHHGMDQHFAHPGGQNFHDHVAKALDLTADQKAAADKLWAEMETRMQPLADQHRAQMEAVHDLLDTANPDPTEVGNKMLAAHAIRNEMKALHEDIATRFSALLNAEQRAKFDQFRAMHEKMGDEGHGPGRHGQF